jgi:hypothetical protein
VADASTAQEEIDLEALDKALATAVHAREIEAQAMQRQRKDLKQSKVSRTSVISFGQKDSVHVKTIKKVAASKSKPPLRQMMAKTSVNRSTEGTRKSLQEEADCQHNRKPASFPTRRSDSARLVKPVVQMQATVLDQSSIQSGKCSADVLQQRLSGKISPVNRRDCKSQEETVHRQKLVDDGQSKPFLLLKDGCELKMPASYGSAVMQAEQLFKKLTESYDRRALPAAHFIERLEQTFNMKREAHLQDDHTTDLISQKPVSCDVITYSHLQELDKFLSLQCKQLILGLDSLICQIVLRDILPCLTKTVSGNRRDILSVRCALQLMNPGMKMLPRAYVTENRASPDCKQPST